MRSLIVILSAFALFLGSCGYHLGSPRPDEMQGVKRLYIKIPGNETQYPGLQADLANHLTDALIQDTTYEVGAKGGSDAVLETTILRVNYDRTRASVRDGIRPEELDMRVKVKWVVLREGEPVMSGESVEDTRFFLSDSRLTTARDNAFPDALSRVSRKIIYNISSSF